MGVLTAIVAIVLVVRFAINTVIMAAALWILSGDEPSPFETDGKGVTWAKCAAINGVVLALDFIGVIALFAGGLGMAALLGILSIATWVVGVMWLFERTFGQAILLALSIWFLNLLLEKLVFAPLVS